MGAINVHAPDLSREQDRPRTSRANRTASMRLYVRSETNDFGISLDCICLYLHPYSIYRLPTISGASGKEIAEYGWRSCPHAGESHDPPSASIGSQPPSRDSDPRRF